MFLPTLPGYSPPGNRAKKAVLTLSALDTKFEDFALNLYHQREHGETKAKPQELWSRDGFLPRMPESLEQLDLLLLTVPKGRKVHSDGIRFQRMRYIYPTLAAYVGESVVLRYDPRDMAEIRVFHDGQSYVELSALVWQAQPFPSATSSVPVERESVSFEKLSKTA